MFEFWLLLFVVSVGCRFQVVSYLQVDLSCSGGFVFSRNFVGSSSAWFPSLSVLLDCFRLFWNLLRC